MHGKEAGSIIRKKGQSVKKLREEVIHASSSQEGTVLRELSLWLDLHYDH